MSLNNIKNNIRVKSSNNPGSKLDTYLSINPELKEANFKNVIETDRRLISKYRTGCHHLKIETGRWQNQLRDERFCLCGPAVQDISHVLLYCPMLQDIRNNDITSIYEFFQQDINNIVIFLLNAEVILKLKK